MTTNPLLTQQQIGEVAQIVTDVFGREFIRYIDPNTLKRISEEFLKIYYEQPLYTFFTPTALTFLSDKIFHDRVLSNFMMNMTDIVSIELASKELNYSDDAFMGTYVTAITYNKALYEAGKAYSLINAELQQSIELSPEALTTLLKNNMWLFVLYILMINFSKTVVFQTLINKK